MNISKKPHLVSDAKGHHLDAWEEITAVRMPTVIQWKTVMSVHVKKDSEEMV